MNDVVNVTDDLALHSGDAIYLRAEDGTYLKRYYSTSGDTALTNRSALFCYTKQPDEWSVFTVEVVGPDKIRLIAENGLYVKRLCCWQDGGVYMSIFAMEHDVPDEFSDFVVAPQGGNRITLQAGDGTYLKRYFGYEGRSVITAYKTEVDRWSIFRVETAETKCHEVVEDIQFDLSQLHSSVSPLAVGKQTLVNNSSEEQTMEFVVSKTVATEKSFHWDFSFKIGFKTEFKASIPLVGSSKNTLSVEAGFTVGGTKSESESQTFESTFPIKCPANTTLQATAMVQLGRVDVPYTARISRYLEDGTGNQKKYTYLVKGVFQGTNAFDLSYIVDTVSTK